MFRQNIYHIIRGFGVDFGGMRAFQSGNMSGEFHHHQLHAVTNSQNWNFVFSAIFYGGDFAFHSPVAETARYDNAIILR